MDVKIIRKALDKREGEEFKMALQHKSKLHLYGRLGFYLYGRKWEVGFEEYLEFVKGKPYRLF